jgi:hypothetical protein
MSNIVEVKFRERRLLKEATQLTNWVEEVTDDSTVETDGDWSRCSCGNWHHRSVFCICERRN